MIGKTVSHYIIVEKLGEGGMGVVYKAEDIKLGRFVALKFLPKELSADEDVRKRFIHEAKSASSLDHPNICAIHEIDETEDGHTFIVMPFYEGESLAQKVKAGPMPVSDAIEIVIQVATGLSRAHEKNIVHRDIKPANIIVTNDGQVKLVDFGVAKLAGQTTVTKTGTRVGTVGYMSPQQALGEALDARSDIFSLGVVLYQLVTGALPFRGDVEAAIMYAIVHEDHIPLANHKDNMPKDLEDIVSRCLEKEVADRYASAAELIFDLDVLRQQLTSGRQVQMGKPRRKRPLRFTKKGWQLAAALAVVVAVVALRPLWQPRLFPPPRVPALAVMDFRDLAGDPTDATGLTLLVEAGLSQNSPVRVIAPELLYDLRRRVFGNAEGPIDAGQALEIARVADATMFVTGQMGVTEGTRFVTWRLVEVATGNSIGGGRVNGQGLGLAADKITADVLPLVAKQTGTEMPATTKAVAGFTTASSEAYRHYTRGKVAQRQLLLTEAAEELKKAVEEDSTFALALFELSRSYDFELEKDIARRYAARAWDHRANLGVKDRMRVEAWKDRVEGDIRSAIVTYEEMLERWPDDKSVLIDLTELRFYNWGFGDAADLAASALELYPDDEKLAWFYAGSLTFTGRLQEGVEATRVLTRRAPENADAWDELGLRFLALGAPDSAEVAFRRALDVDPNYVWSRAGLGYCDYVRGDVPHAIEKFDALLASGIAAPADSVELLTEVTFWPGLSLLYAEEGRYQKALDMFEQIPLAETETQVEGRIQLLLRMGRPSEALQLVEALADTTVDRFHRIAAEHYRARALVALGSLDAARQSVSTMDSLIAVGGHPEPFLKLRVATTIALASGDYDTALTAVDEMLRQGVPPGGLHDIERRESRAQALVLAGRLEDAAAELESLLSVYGSHAVARYELGRIYENLRRPAEARTEYRKFLDAWKLADGDMPQLADARARLDLLAASRQ